MDELLINNRPHLYVDGNPVSYRDPSGNNLSNSWLYAIGTYVIAKSQGMNDQQALSLASVAFGVGQGKDKNRNNFLKHQNVSKAIKSDKIGKQVFAFVSNPIKALEKSDVGRFTTHIGNDLRLNRLSIQPFIKASADITFEVGEIGFTSDFQFGLNISIKHRNRYIIYFDLGNEPGGRGKKNDYGSPDPDFPKYDEKD